MNTSELEQRIGYQFKDRQLIETALTHSSYANEHSRKGCEYNERMEFLGDAVLEVISSDFLYHNYPDMPEGDLSRLRASIVCEPTLWQCAREFSLQDFIRLGTGEEKTGGRQRPSVVSDAMEALIGAIYLDGGFSAAQAFVMRFVLTDIEEKKLYHDSKTTLQEILQEQGRGLPVYEITDVSGPDHARQYTAQVMCGDKVLGTGTAGSKKHAQQEAAYRALVSMNRERESHII